MWSPTHVQVTVIRARNIKTKGKSGTNDAYVSIRLGKEKYQTSVQERCAEPAWNEKCQFVLNEKVAEVKLKVYHRNLLGKDDLLGCAEIRLDDIDVHERTRNRWYTLHGKDKELKDDKSRGELECVVFFYVENLAGSQLNLFKSDKTKRFSLKRSPEDKPLFKWSNRSSGSVANLSLDRRRSISTNEIEGNTLLEEDNNNVIHKTNAKERELDSESTTGNRKDSSNFENDVTLNDSLKSDEADTKKKKGFFSSRISIKPKNRGLLGMSKLSQSTLGINVTRQSSFNSPKGEKQMRIVPFGRIDPFNDSLADDTNSSDGQNEEIETEMKKAGEKTKINGNKNSNNDDVMKTGVSDSTKQTADSQSLESYNLEKVPGNIGDESKNNRGSEGKGKTKRRAPQPSDLNLNGDSSAGGFRVERGVRSISSSSDKALSPRNSDFNKNDVGLNSNHDSHDKAMTSSELELCRYGDSGTNGREEGDGTDVESPSSSRPSSPPVISINYRSRLSESQQNNSSSKPEYVGLLLDDKKTTNKVTQTQLNSDEPELSAEILLEFYNYSRNDLIKMIIEQQRSIQKKDSHITDLESYIDNLVVKVIDLQPKLLRAPNESPTNPPSPVTPRDFRGTMTLPANMKSYKIESKATEGKTQESLYGRIVRSASIKNSSEKMRSPFRAIQAVLK